MGDSVPTPYLLILSHSTPLHSIPFHSIPSHHLRVYFRTFSQLRIQIRPHLILQTMPDTSADHLPESPEQSATKSQLLNLKEKNRQNHSRIQRSWHSSDSEEDTQGPQRSFDIDMSSSSRRNLLHQMAK